MKLLKSMMAGASPAQRKALARQLGQIANELKAAVKNFSDASGTGQTSAPKSANAAISPDNTAQQANPQTATADSAPDSTGANSTETDKHQANAQTATASGQSGQGASNKEKQDFVREAKELASDIKRGPMDALRVCRIGAQIARGLQAAGDARHAALWREGAAKLRRVADEQVPEPFRDSFLRRQPVHEALLRCAG